MNFEINPECLTAVSVHTVYYRAKDPSNPTPLELLEIIKYGPVLYTASGSNDHPEFEKLRNMLEEKKYIKCQRGWCNGDIVLKSFSLNGARFKKHEQFYSGAAIKWTVDQKLKNDIK